MEEVSEGDRFNYCLGKAQSTHAANLIKAEEHGQQCMCQSLCVCLCLPWRMEVTLGGLKTAVCLQENTI